jgi:DNA helicase-2/ATP-dependent DNA helicase PcrA
MTSIEGLKKELNPEQYKTVTTISGPLLIIAGAGSGKTRTITYRMAYMLQKGISQSSILALTFTNKAAKEMSERVKKITGKKLTQLTVSTFHAFGAKMLREEIECLGYRTNFSIYDQADKIALIKNTARELKIDPNTLDLYSLASFFSLIKTAITKWDKTNSVHKKLYEEYIEHLRIYNAVDFDDLITLPVKIFNQYPDILEKYRERYKYIMIDEFQDTSRVQYDLVKLLAEKSRNICAVGDDDQSIYSWRGADYSNILQLEKDFPEVVEIKLEQNYRSTGNILKAANTLISNNKNRKAKELWTGIESGNLIEISYPENEAKESEFIADMLSFLKKKDNISYHNFGILIRTNSLAASIEDALLGAGIPYKVSGGTSFFQRQEVKDIIAYLRIMTNPDDDVNLLRIINTPRRGIGKKSIEYINTVAENKKCSLFSAISAICAASDSALGDKTKISLQEFLNLISSFKARFLSGKNMAKTLEEFINNIDYWDYLVSEYQKSKDLAKWKYKNVQIFTNLLERWETDPDNIKPDIYQYLNRITLVTRDDIEDNEDGKVNLMTIHAAKGLEFDIVFLAGVEDIIIPHARAIEENENNIEEERRLFYVAITRAKSKLFITSCKQRRYLNSIIESKPSRFLVELPVSLLKNYEQNSASNKEKAMKMFEKINAIFEK